MLDSTLHAQIDSPVTNTGLHGSLPSPLGLCLSSSLSSLVAFGTVAVLSFHAFVPTPFGVSLHPLLRPFTQAFYLSSSPPPGLTGCCPTWPGLFLSMCLHSDPWDLLAFVFVCPVGLSLRLCLVLLPPSRSFSLSQSPLWDAHFYLPLICLLFFVERNERLS